MKVGPSPVAGLCRKQGGSGTETQAQATGCKDVIAESQEEARKRSSPSAFQGSTALLMLRFQTSSLETERNFCCPKSPGLWCSAMAAPGNLYHTHIHALDALYSVNGGPRMPGCS